MRAWVVLLRMPTFYFPRFYITYYYTIKSRKNLAVMILFRIDSLYRTFYFFLYTKFQ